MYRRSMRSYSGGRRTGWDSNPRYGCPYTGFRDRLLQPLGHLSRVELKRIQPRSGSQQADQDPGGQTSTLVCALRMTLSATLPTRKR